MKKEEEKMTDYRDVAIQIVEDEYVDPMTMIIACLKYMSNDDVRDMLEANELDELSAWYVEEAA
jgi:hypothetical protein